MDFPDTVLPDTVLPDTVLAVNGRIWTGRAGAGRAAGALAIRSGKIVDAGETAEIRSAYYGVDEVDLGGRTVVPGLIDGHNHAVRGGADAARGIDLSGCATPEGFLAAVRAAAGAAGPGEWVAAIGGWHPSALGGWAPTREQLDEIAPGNPVFLQAMYEFAVANRAACALVPGVAADENGRVYGTGEYNAFLAAMKTPSLERQVRGTAAMFRDFAAAGITGVHDPGGLGLTPASYGAVRELHRAGDLKCRLRLYYSALSPGGEAGHVAAWLKDGFGGPEDTVLARDMLRAVGIGEVVHFGCHDFEGLTDFEITGSDAAELTAITRAVAAAGLPMQIHGVLDSSIGRILDCWEAVDAEVPLRGLRFVLAHGGPDRPGQYRAPQTPGGGGDRR